MSSSMPFPLPHSLIATYGCRRVRIWTSKSFLWQTDMTERGKKNRIWKWAKCGFAWPGLWDTFWDVPRWLIPQFSTPTFAMLEARRELGMALCLESFHEAKYLSHKAHMVKHAKSLRVLSASSIFLLVQLHKGLHIIKVLLLINTMVLKCLINRRK